MSPVDPAQRQIVHVDLDAFYASVEQRDDPRLRGRPVIVGGHARRGVVIAASYEVRPFGVRSAMSMAEALRRAPEALVIPPRFAAYAEASERVFEIFRTYTPLVEGLSLDEAFLDVSASGALFGRGAAIARQIRARIRDEVGLPASAGIAAVKFVAKIASDLAKPDGQLDVPWADTAAFLAPLPVGRLWGVGPKTEAVLHAAGLRTLGDVVARGEAALVSRLGPSGAHFAALARGDDVRAVEPEREAKSLGAEDTFEHDLRGVEALSPIIHGQALRVARRLRSAGLRARTVVLKLKTSDFQIHTRRTSVAEALDDGQALYRHALELLEAFELQRPVRLTGVSVTNLDHGPDQLPLLDTEHVRAKRLNVALDAIASRFGTAAVRPADLAEGDMADGPFDAVRSAMGVSRLDVDPAGSPGPGPARGPRGRDRRR